jgi:dihydroneopterin aldolase
MTGVKPDDTAKQADSARGPKNRPDMALRAQRIRLCDLTLPCRIGVTEEERAQRQRLRFNIELEVSPEAPRHDRIGEVVDYGPLAAKVRDVCTGAEYRLLESLAEEIAAACMFDPRVVLARVRIEKLDRYADMGGIGCELEYRRQDGS